VKQLDGQQGKHTQVAGGKEPSVPFYFCTLEKEAELENPCFAP